MAYGTLNGMPLQHEDANGNPLVGGTLEFYEWNNSTPLAAYTDSVGTTLGTSCTLNSLGKPQTSGGTACQVFGSDAATTGYKVIVKDSTGSVVPPTYGPLFPSISQATLDAIESADIDFTDALAPSYLKTVSDIINGEEVSALRFIATGSHAAIRAHTSTTDLATSFSDIANSGARGIYFPYGQYQKNSATTPPSNQRWRGDGRGNTVIQMPQSNQTLNYNFLDNGSSDLSNFAMIDLTLKGSLPYQTNAASASKGFAFWSRGAVNNVHFVRVEVTQFGDQSNTGGGGIILGHPTTSTTTGKASRGIKFLHCTFDTNANVCGLYLSQGGDGGTYDVEIIGNFFNGGYSSGTAQNCVYILGADASRVIDTLTMTGNRFRIANSIDQCVEFNWVKNFTVSNNPCRVLSGVSTCSGHILLRDGCIGGTVTNNPMRDDSGNAVAGISLVRFASPGTGTQEDITIDSNQIYGFDYGIQIDSGSYYGTANDNVIRGCSQGFRIAACNDFEISHNKIIGCGYAGVFSGGSAGMRRIKFHHNDSYGCTTGAYAGLGNPDDIEYLEFEHNVDQGSAGTYMIDMNMAASTGNRFVENRSSLTPINPSYIADWATIKLADTGPITIDDGTTTPNVRSGVEYVCASTAGTTIGGLTGTGYVGQIVTIRLTTNWTVDFTGTTLKGNGGVDLTGTTTNGIRCQWNGTNWLCEVIGA